MKPADLTGYGCRPVTWRVSNSAMLASSSGAWRRSKVSGSSMSDGLIPHTFTDAWSAVGAP
ncbi:hypothetical protein LUX57_37530 [Actinomadura madurae]|nr:hypothetical protein [Actinomadura madurae]MCP9970186.1 hypothetical protein [Actinomadura madurae]